MKTLFILTLSSIMLTLMGCSYAQNKEDLTWSVLYQSQHCSFQTPQAMAFDAKEGQEIYQKEISHRSALVFNPKQSASKETHPRIANNQSLLVIAMGQKPSGGFGIAINSVKFDKSVLEASVDWKTPSSNSMTTSALTSPCQLILMDNPISKSELEQLTIEVLDQLGQNVFQ